MTLITKSMKKIFSSMSVALAVELLCVTPNARASSVDYGATVNLILTSTGATANVGSSVELGTFPANFNFNLNRTNFAATNGAFTLYGTTTIGSNGAPAGEFFDSTANLDSSGDTGKQLYIWVFNTATPSTASNWAIVTNPAWVGPATGAAGFINIDTADSGTTIASGALGSIVTTTGPGGFNVQMGVVPEPSTYASSALGILGIALLAKYQRKSVVS